MGSEENHGDDHGTEALLSGQREFELFTLEEEVALGREYLILWPSNS